MKTKSIIKSLIALCAVAISAQAQETPASSPTPSHDGPPPMGNRPKPPLLTALDANNDGTISADEIANASTALRTLDKNKDGTISGDEIHPMPPKDGPGGRPHPPMGADGPQGNRPAGPRPEKGKRPRPDGPGSSQDKGPREHGHRPPPPVVNALDKNHDGKVSADEIDQASASLKTLDKNNDGQLTGEEIHPPRPPKPPEGNGPENDGDGQPPVPPME